MDSLFSALPVLLPSLLLIAVYLVGLILLSTKLRLYRKGATLGMMGFGALLLGQLVRAGVTVMTLPPFRGSTSMRDLSTVFTATGWLVTALMIAGAILLLLAIFADRPER